MSLQDIIRLLNTINAGVQEKVFPVKKSRKIKSISLVCPDCSGRSLTIAKSIELGSDRDYDETSFQALRCKKCSMVGVGLYQESRRGAQDSWHHFGYRMKESDFNELLKQLTGCSCPRDKHCSCKAHACFGSKENGVLRPLEKLLYDSERFYIRTLS